MIPKIKEKELAIKLRQQGKSYSEILKEVPVAKSSLSLWLRSVGLSRRIQHRLTEKKYAAALRGAAQRKARRISSTQEIVQRAQKEIRTISKKELWFMGVMLYWAEGSKEKEYRPGSGVQFSNSDPQMIRFFLVWLQYICGIPKEDIWFDLMIHITSQHRVKEVLQHWISVTGFPPQHFQHVYYKKNNIKTNRKNTGNSYYGVVKLRVRASSTLLRKINGWIQGVNAYDWGVAKW